MKGDFTFTMSTEDYNALQLALSELERVDRTATVKAALDRGIEMIRQQGEANLDAYNGAVTGNLKKSLSKKVVSNYAAAGFKRSTKYSRINGGNHAHIVDQGATTSAGKPRYKKNGRSTGEMYKGKNTTIWGGKAYTPHGKPYFWTNAVESKGPLAIEKLNDAIYDEMAKIGNRN